MSAITKCSTSFTNLTAATDRGRSGTKMILRTDTIGHFERPTEMNIRAAISYPGNNTRENDLVKLMVDDENYLCVWIGKKEAGHILELRCHSCKIVCQKRLNSYIIHLPLINLEIFLRKNGISYFNLYKKSQDYNLKKTVKCLLFFFYNPCPVFFQYPL